MRLRAQVEAEERSRTPPRRQSDALAWKSAELEAHIRELARLKERTDAKIDEYRSIRETGSCPTCDREADPGEFVEKEQHKVMERKEQAHVLEEHELDPRRQKAARFEAQV